MVDSPGASAALFVTARRVLRRPAAVIGLVIVTVFVFTAVAAPWIAPYPEDQTDFALALKGPSPGHPLGNDDLGRDLFSRLLYGARLSLIIGVVSVGIGFAAGVPLGLMAGYYGGWFDALLMRVVDVMLSFPAILLAIGIVAVRGAGMENAIVAVGIVSIPQYVRIVRASVLGIKGLEFVTAAKSAGSGTFRLLAIHIFPHSLGPILVQSTLQVASAILSAAGLGFLGLGAPAHVPEWGTMLAKGQAYVFSAPHLSSYPGLAIMLVVMGFNLFGDALRDALDPRMANR